MTIRFACGHLTTLGDNPSGAPVCACGETRVQHVAVRPPRFHGTCTGPYAETASLPPGVVNVAPGGPLVIGRKE